MPVQMPFAFGVGMESLLNFARVIAFLIGASAYTLSLPPTDSTARRKMWQNLAASLAIAMMLIAYGTSRSDWLGQLAKSPVGQCGILLLLPTVAGHVSLLIDKLTGFAGAKIDASKPAAPAEKDTDAT